MQGHFLDLDLINTKDRLGIAYNSQNLFPSVRGKGHKSAEMSEVEGFHVTHGVRNNLGVNENLKIVNAHAVLPTF